MKFASVVLILGLANQVLSVPVQSDDTFNNFIQTMVKQMDLGKDPCQDFNAYACGKIEGPEVSHQESDEDFDDPEYMEEIYKKVLTDKTSNPLEEKVQKYFQSCEKAAGNWPFKPEVHNEVKLDNILKDVDAFKTVTAWPVEKDLALADYSKLIAEAASIREIFGYILVEENNGKLEIYAPNHDSFPTYKSNNEKYILESMNKHSPKTAESNAAAAKEIAAFEGKLAEILKEKIVKTTIAISAEATGLNFNEFLTVLKKNWMLDAKMEAVIVDQRIPKIVDLLKGTNSKVIANHMVYKIYSFIEEKTNEVCTNQRYFQPAIIDRVWTDSVSVEDQKNYIDTLKAFEEVYNQILTKEGTNDTDHEIEEELKITYECFEKRGEWFKELKYDEIVIDEKNFLQNVLNVGRFFFSTYNKDVLDLFTIKIMNHYYLLKGFKEMGLNEKPMLQYLVAKNLQLWGSAFSSNPKWIKPEMTETIECLKKNQNVEIPVYDSRDVVDFFASQMRNFEDFKTFLTKTEKKQIEMEEKVLADNKLNYMKAYFIAFKQYSCAGGAEYVDLTLSNTKEFAETFSCKPKDPMNPENKCSVTV